MQDVCEMVWCGGGEGIIRTSHPALEGTHCGTGRWCIEGKCKSWGSSPPSVVHGSWSRWDDTPSASCGADCSECNVAGQMKVKRSIRLCESPALVFWCFYDFGLIYVLETLILMRLEV